MFRTKCPPHDPLGPRPFDQIRDPLLRAVLVESSSATEFTNFNFSEKPNSSQSQTQSSESQTDSRLLLFVTSRTCCILTVYRMTFAHWRATRIPSAVWKLACAPFFRSLHCLKAVQSFTSLCLVFLTATTSTQSILVSLFVKKKKENDRHHGLSRLMHYWL